MAVPDLNAYRLVHGVADGMAGLAVDRYADVAVVHADSFDILDRWRAALEADLAEFERGYAKIHPPRANRLSPDETRRLAPDTPLWGNPVEELEALEFGTRYLVRPASGLSVGLFLDMREVRAWLRQHAEGRSVLNLFGYTCSLGIAAKLGRADRVINVDVSRAALEWGRRNYALNDLPVGDRDFIYGDAFDWLGRFARRAARFDLVIVDPPSFSSTPFSVTRDYPRLVSAAARVVAPGGILLAATNHAGTSDERFELWLRNGLNVAGRDARQLQSWHEPATDFPVAVGRAAYLKVRALGLD